MFSDVDALITASREYVEASDALRATKSHDQEAIDRYNAAQKASPLTYDACRAILAVAEQRDRLAYWMGHIADMSGKRAISITELDAVVEGTLEVENDFEHAFEVAKIMAAGCLTPELRAAAEQQSKRDLRTAAKAQARLATDGVCCLGLSDSECAATPLRQCEGLRAAGGEVNRGQE